MRQKEQKGEGLRPPPILGRCVSPGGCCAAGRVLPSVTANHVGAFGGDRTGTKRRQQPLSEGWSSARRCQRLCSPPSPAASRFHRFQAAASPPSRGER